MWAHAHIQITRFDSIFYQRVCISPDNFYMYISVLMWAHAHSQIARFDSVFWAHVYARIHTYTRISQVLKDFAVTPEQSRAAAAEGQTIVSVYEGEILHVINMWACMFVFSVCVFVFMGVVSVCVWKVVNMWVCMCVCVFVYGRGVSVREGCIPSICEPACLYFFMRFCFHGCGVSVCMNEMSHLIHMWAYTRVFLYVYGCGASACVSKIIHVINIWVHIHLFVCGTGVWAWCLCERAWGASTSSICAYALVCFCMCFCMCFCLWAWCRCVCERESNILRYAWMWV
jgi:hypothetical protein